MLKLCRPALSVAVSILGNSGAGKKGSSRAKPAAGQTSSRNAVRFTARLRHLQHVSEAQWTLLTTKRMPMMHSKVWSGVSDKTPDTRKGITLMNLQECHVRLERHGHRKEEAAAVMPLICSCRRLLAMDKLAIGTVYAVLFGMATKTEKSREVSATMVRERFGQTPVSQSTLRGP